MLFYTIRMNKTKRTALTKTKRKKNCVFIKKGKKLIKEEKLESWELNLWLLDILGHLCKADNGCALIEFILFLLASTNYTR